MPDATAAIDLLVVAATDTMVEVRRDLHAFPELAFDEHRTTHVITDRLDALGLTARPCPTATGAVYELSGGLPGHTVLLRADIDALPIHELDHGRVVSRTDGLMHACGHDAHTAAMLGVAEVLSRRAEDLPGRYVFVFQPAEESLGGGRAMVDGGVLDGLNAKAAIGCHVTSFAPVGLVAMRGGVIMSEAHSFKVTASGAGGHGALMGAAGNVLLAIAQLAGELPMVVEGLSHEGTDCACSAGMLQAGSAPNVVPSEASLRGTLRTFTPEQTTDAMARLHLKCEELAAAYECAVTIEFSDSAPAVVNDVAVTDVVRDVACRAIGDTNVLAIPPLTPSDDVSEFLNRIPGCYFFVGAGRLDSTSGAHHSPAFTIDEGCLPIAARVLSAAAVELASDAATQRVGP